MKSLLFPDAVRECSLVRKGTWLTGFTGQSYKSWLGFSFEMVCLKHADQIKSALGIAAVSTENYTWSGKSPNRGAQIDLLIDRADNVINLCEMKFYNAEYNITKSYATEIRHKLKPISYKHRHSEKYICYDDYYLRGTGKSV